nr:hypothetical protein [Tanacetum cinerariifolium]
FDDHFSADTLFDMGYENEIGGGIDQRLVAVACQEMLKMFKGKGGDNSVLRDHASTSHTASSAPGVGQEPSMNPNFNCNTPKMGRSRIWSPGHVTS